MATILTLGSHLLSVPFSAATDFTELATYCEHFAQTMLESDDPALKMALLARLNAALALLRPTLDDPIPPHLLEQFVADVLPEAPVFEPSPELLCDYCLALTQVLTLQGLPPETGQSLAGLLAELVWHFAGNLKAPRWETLPACGL
ncbi:hypothetical protein [Mangrovibacter yixingensis]|uniref:hypothetical protein n=1 Tax=Mangrovibacter yixingensis TaxID=1529639 RepID=UPI001CFBF8C5|nr:hypothetical protein [Mangrovibacter yixingensis]